MSTSFTDEARPESIGESLSRAWQAIRTNIWLFGGFMLLFAIAYGVVAMLPLLNLAAWLFSFVLPVSVYSAVEAADGGREIQFSDFFNWTPRLSRLLVGMLVQIGIGLAVFIPLVLMVVILGLSTLSAGFSPSLFAGPASIIFALVLLLLLFVYGIFTFSMNFLLLKFDMSIGEVIRLSWKTGWRNLGSIILFALLCIGLYLLGCIALLVGLLVTIPLMLGTQYFFLRSRFPDEKRDQWDFDSRSSNESYPLP